MGNHRAATLRGRTHRRIDISQAFARVQDASSPLLLSASLCLGLSILYQIYFYEFNQGELVGGERERLILKLTSTVLFFGAARRYLSFSALGLNLFLKLPLLFVAATLVVTGAFLDSWYAQALNLLFFLPILFIDWNRPGGAHLFRSIWATIVVTVTVQLVLDPVFKIYSQVGWSNAAIVGGMGNPNVFGLFLIVSGLACTTILPAGFRFLSSILFLSTALTGSLASAIVGSGCLLAQLVLLLRRTPAKTLLLVGSVIALLSVSTIVVDIYTSSTSIEHVFSKLQDVGEFLRGTSVSKSESVVVRVEYTRNGLRMLGESPLSVITGHPHFIPMYSGDGMWLAYLVTFGLPLTLYFLSVNVLAIVRGLRSTLSDLRFAAYVVITMQIFFATNRILDYWPVALVYLVAFSYLATKGVVRPVAGTVHAPAELGMSRGSMSLSAAQGEDQSRPYLQRLRAEYAPQRWTSSE